MALNAQQKGKEGEREVTRELNAILDGILVDLGLPPQNPAKPRIQRNQNQSAVGGCDLTGTFELAIEVKRQEQLAVNTWWAQCVKSAEELGHKPVLIFRQNTPGGGRKSWRVITTVQLEIAGAESLECRAEITYEDFKRFFRAWAREHLLVELQLAPRPTAQLQTGEASNEFPEAAPVRQRFPDLFPEL